MKAKIKKLEDMMYSSDDGVDLGLGLTPTSAYADMMVSKLTRENKMDLILRVGKTERPGEVKYSYLVEAGNKVEAGTAVDDKELRAKVLSFLEEETWLKSL